MGVKNLKKGLTAAAVLIIAVSGSVSYISKGKVDVQAVARTSESIEISTESEDADNADVGAKTKTETDAESKAESIGDDTASNKVDINSASLSELQIAPGIGPSKAQAIIDYRNEYGSFSCVEELIEVSGIGEKTLAKIKDYYCVK